MHKTLLRMLAVTALLFASLGAAPLHSLAAGLAYDEHTRGPAPIPPSERNLQTVTAEQWLKVADKNDILEGAIFDARGNLLFCDVSNGRVLRATPDKKLSTFVDLDGYSPGGIAFHKDGRLFIAALDSTYTKGAIFAVNPDGKGLRAIVSPDAGYLPNDLVMDAHGGFYFTDFKGSPTQPKGGVYYVSPDFKTITCVAPNLAMANGVALSPDGAYLWVTEFGRNLLHRVELADATTMGPIGTSIPYRFA
ncbi:SMP-30/gluconolactonase/LRE family protein, partial [Desulfovibrio sp. 1214_IL3152]